MGCRSRFLRRAFARAGLAALACAVPAAAQSQPGESVSAPAAVQPPAATQASDLQADGFAGQLDAVRDFTLDFDNPGFRAVLRHTFAAGIPRQSDDAVDTLSDWRVLLERPADFRGRTVRVEGRVGRNTSWRFVSGPEAALGPVWQLELRGPPSAGALACTVILTQPADDIPLGATVRVSGVFVQVRGYVADSGATRYAPLLVGVAPELVSTAGPAVPREFNAATPNTALAVALGLVAALIAGWLLLRARLGRVAGERADEAAVQPAPFSLASDLADWARRDDPEHDAAGAASASPGRRPRAD